MTHFYEVFVFVIDTTILINDKLETLEEVASDAFNNSLHRFSANGFSINYEKTNFVLFQSNHL